MVATVKPSSAGNPDGFLATLATVSSPAPSPGKARLVRTVNKDYSSIATRCIILAVDFQMQFRYNLNMDLVTSSTVERLRG